MKRKWIAAMCALVGIAAAAFLLLWLLSARSFSFSQGVCLFTQNGSCLLIVDESPIVLHNCSNREDLFDDLQTGDTVLVLHDGIQETYPAGTGAYRLWKRADGDISAISEDVLTTLGELGWYADSGNYPLSSFAYSSQVAWANYDENGWLFLGALNADKMSISSVQHLPIRKIETYDELIAFQALRDGVLTVTASYDEVPSFCQITEHMDEAFFAENTLLIIYVSSGSCSFRYDVHSISRTPDSLCVRVEKATEPEIGDCAMAGWWVTGAVDKSHLEGVVAYDAYLS